MEKKKLVVLTGAGVSAESGLKTFRDSGGLWEGYDVQEVATPAAWKKNPGLVLEFYNQRRQNIREAQPNAAHIGLVELEKYFDVHIITQNIDDLHERAGSTNVLHLHGEIFRMRSEYDDSLIYPVDDRIEIGDLAEDGAQLRPDIVWFGEAVPMIEPAAAQVAQADIVVIIGSSLLVYPAAGLIDIAPANTPVFILDQHIPATRLSGIHAIEEPAGKGIAELTGKLMQLI